MKIDKVKIFDHLKCILENKLPFKAPGLIAKGKVIEKWVDYNGHMNMAYYVQCFEEASDYLLDLLGIGFRYAVDEKKGVFVIKCDINYRREILINEEFTISVRSISFSGKKLTLNLEMKSLNEIVIADYKILNLNVDLKTKKSINFSNKILENIS